MTRSDRADAAGGEADEPADEPFDERCDGPGPSVLGRVDGIIAAFDDVDRVLTLHELTLRTGLPKSTVHRMVEQLCRIGWLERETSGYRIGMRLFEIGGLATRRSRLSESAYPHLHALSVATGFAVQLAILDGVDVVYVERLPLGDFRLPTREGGRQPAYCTALGKAMLAFDEAATAEVLAQRLQRRTSCTLVTPHELKADLDRVAETGLAFDHQEAYEGLACVAAPLRNAGRAIAAVSVTGPVARIDLHAVAPQVQSAAQAIWRDRFRRN
jgi:DNA-binding IclR family transcriptional regulator